MRNLVCFLNELSLTIISTYTASLTHARIISAYELIDWLRLLEQPLRVVEVERLSAILVKFHIPSIAELAEHLDPAQVSFWDALDLTSRYSELQAQ